ncbi:hypothetical protein O3M35_000757 [Rhynocoris fuscipes]|uniref:FACT complex subunit SSRP1 n=1 Tax=Rhynocoris fuscipes TaxID=488301 RepID=A0AAW1DMV1_9HEMI
MTDVLEYFDITAEIKGALCPGRLKLTDSNIIFKNNKTGKVEQLAGSDLELCNWQKLVGTWGLRLFLKNGSLRRFTGFKESDLEKVAKYFKTKYSQDLSEKELSVRGWNWGTAKFAGSVLSFDVNNLTAFDIPLSNVSQCTTGKNEVTVEFHQNDEAPVSLMEIRFHIPSTELAGDDPVESFHSQVMQKASVISVSGDAIAIFREIQCLTPRGRYDIKIFSSFFQLHGKTFDYKIPMATVLRLFSLPHKDGRQNFIVVSLDPPIKQGQTRYHYLVYLFGQDEETSLELPFSEEELAEKYEGKLTKEMSGPTHEVLSKIMKVLVNRKITVPSGGFVGHSGTPAVGCSYKAAAGYMYPLERGFIYIHKPPLHIRFEEISSVNFARSGGSTRSFDFEIELKSGVVHTFSSIEKEEYGKLFDFITSKKLRVKNKKSDKPTYGADDFGDSDDEKEPDAYLARVKREAEERDEEEGGSSEDESTDEDFKPQEQESDVAEEFDSNPSTTDSEEDSDASGGGGGGSGEDGEKKEKKKKKEKKEKKKKTVTISEKPRKKREKKEKDSNKPKRAPSAYMLWFNENREKIKQDNPGISFTDIAKKAGELWKKLDDKSEWEKKSAKMKDEYLEAMSEYKATAKDRAKGESGSTKKKSKSNSSSSSSSKPANSSPIKSGSGGAYISKEFIEDTDSSDSDDDKKTTTKKETAKSDDEKEKKSKDKVKQKKSSGEDDSDDNKDASSKDSDADDSEKESKKKEKNNKNKDKSKKRKAESDGDKDKKKKKKKAESSSEEEEEEEEDDADDDEEELEDTPSDSD